MESPTWAVDPADVLFFKSPTLTSGRYGPTNYLGGFLRAWFSDSSPRCARRRARIRFELTTFHPGSRPRCLQSIVRTHGPRSESMGSRQDLIRRTGGVSKT